MSARPHNYSHVSPQSIVIELESYIRDKPAPERPEMVFKVVVLALALIDQHTNKAPFRFIAEGRVLQPDRYGHKPVEQSQRPAEWPYMLSAVINRRLHQMLPDLVALFSLR